MRLTDRCTEYHVYSQYMSFSDRRDTLTDRDLSRSRNRTRFVPSTADRPSVRN